MKYLLFPLFFIFLCIPLHSQSHNSNESGSASNLFDSQDIFLKNLFYPLNSTFGNTIHNLNKVKFACDSILSMKNESICKGGSITLEATGYDEYIWSPTNGLSDASAPNPVASPLVTTTYKVSGKKVSPNLIFNGDFELGNVGFTSGYTNSPNDIGPPSVYAITDNAMNVHPGASPCNDHTSGLGLFMAINGAGIPNTTVWQQNISVETNTNYMFSAWVTNWSSIQSNLAKLQFSINGQLLGNVFQTLPLQCEWKEFFIIWNSGSSTSADIKLVNQFLQVFGNDFGLDDIKFRQICDKVDSVTVNVIDKNYAGTPIEFSICEQKDSTLNLNDLIIGEDFGGNWLNNGLPVGSFNNGTGWLDIIDVPSGSYYIPYIVIGNGVCPPDTTTVNIHLLQKPLAIAGIDQEIGCKTPVVNIGSGLNGSAPNLEVIWTSLEGHHFDDSGLAIQTINQPGTYIIKVENLQSGCFNFDTVVIGKGSEFIEDVIIESKDSKCFNSNNGLINIQEIVGGNPPFVYILTGEVQESNATGKFMNLPPGNYFLKLEDSEGCIDNFDFVLNQPLQPSLDYSGDTIVNCGDTIELQVKTNLSNSTIANVEWYSGQNLIDTSKSLTKIVYPTGSSSYLVNIKDINGCEIETRFNIKVENEVAYFAPNVFTPNYDGINDEFKIYFNEVVDKILTFRVYDRWGALMLEQKNMDVKSNLFGWDGSYRTQSMLPGVYVWMAEYKDCKGNIVLIKGDVTLIN